MRDIVLEYLPRDRAVRLLDLGCGTGSLAFRLAAALPAAVLVGIDISVANIRTARTQQTGQPNAANLLFETTNYLDYSADAFDLIVADGVLHLIPGDTTTLVRKLASDLVGGGVLVCGMPFDCAYNRAFAGLRRALRFARSPWLDQLILSIGRILHGHEMDEAHLRERVDYMYLSPVRMMGRSLAASLAAAGFRQVASHPMTTSSLSQLKYEVRVFVRDPDLVSA